MELTDDFRKEVETIMKKWIKLLHELDPKYIETLRMQINYESRLKDLRVFLREEVDREIEKAFRAEFPNEDYTQNIKNKIYKTTSNYHEQLLETIKKIAHISNDS